MTQMAWSDNGTVVVIEKSEPTGDLVKGGPGSGRRKMGEDIIGAGSHLPNAQLMAEKASTATEHQAARDYHLHQALGSRGAGDQVAANAHLDAAQAHQDAYVAHSQAYAGNAHANSMSTAANQASYNVPSASSIYNQRPTSYKAELTGELAKGGPGSGRHKGSCSLLQVREQGESNRPAKLDTQNPTSNWLVHSHSEEPPEHQPSYLRMQPMDGGKPVIASTYSDKGEYQPGDHIKAQDDGNRTTPFPGYNSHSGGSEMEITHVADNVAGLSSFPKGNHSYYVFK